MPKPDGERLFQSDGPTTGAALNCARKVPKEKAGCPDQISKVTQGWLKQ